MEMICKKEAITEKGQKIMDFTLGLIYVFSETDEGILETTDDKGFTEGFFNVDIMFEKVE